VKTTNKESIAANSRAPKEVSHDVNGIRIDLQTNEKVFSPSPHGVFFAENIHINPGEKVIDIGTGTGFLAILAAKQGAVVCATDNNIAAIELAKKNFQLNGVCGECMIGEYFAGFSGQFDVILANLPQKIIIDCPDATHDVNGGAGGNEILLMHLNLAKEHMTRNTRMYIFVYTLTDYQSTLRFINNHFNAKILAAKSFSEPLVDSNPSAYLELAQQGAINIFKDNGTWMATELFLELSLK
jgi:release factor glutamine methyltransferase